MPKFITIKFHDIKSYRWAKLFSFGRLQLLSGGVFLAGGALRTLISLDEVITDYDLFFESEDKMKQTRERLAALGFELTYECPEGKLFTYKGRGIKIQVICENYYLTGRELISQFDFTACAAAYDGNTLWIHRHFPRAGSTKTLKLLNLTFPVATLGRLVKYKEKGYKTGECRRQFVERLQSLFEGGFRLDDVNGRFYID